MRRLRWVLALLLLAGCQSTVSGQSVSASQGTVEFREVVGQPVSASTSPSPELPPATAPPSRFGRGLQPQPPVSSTPGDNDRQNVDLSDEAAVRAALRALDCSLPVRGRIDPARPLVACDKQSVKYALKPAFLTGADVAKAEAQADTQSPGWYVQLSFTSNGSKIWGDFTAAHVDGQVAIVLDGKVVSAPVIRGAIPGGETQISGNFTRAEAEDLAARLTSR